MRSGAQIPVLACLMGIMLTSESAVWTQLPNANSKQEPDVILGVLEDLPGHYSGGPDFRAVRVVFQRFGGEWRAFPSECEDQQCLRTLTKSYPQSANWTIIFAGRKIGEVKTQAPSDFAWYADVGLEKPTSSGPIPTIGERSEEYSGFLASSVYRPLVALSKPNALDPDDWRRMPPTPEQIVMFRAVFRGKYPNVSNCKNPEENVLSPWKYTDGDIEIGAFYTSAIKLQLVEISLKGYACDGPTEDGGPFKHQWFVVDPAGRAQYLDSDMWLVDAGDYDNDGKSELLFAVSGYNQDGYRLYSSDFNKRAEFLFNYH